VTHTIDCDMGADCTCSRSGEPYIRAVSGRRIYLRDPGLNEALHLEDFAHALARIARFNGHTLHRYSVASHSLMVADLAPRMWRADALMHDAAEGVLGDVTSPLKGLLPDYRALEARWADAIEERFGLHGTGSRAVKAADRLAYAIERRDLAPYADARGGCDPEVEIPPSAPRCTAYVDAPHYVAARWLRECRAAGVPEVA